MIDRYPYKKKERKILDAETLKEEGHVKMEAEMGVTQLQPRRHQKQKEARSILF